jgi:outer membrane protein OmpA-like peptidoglycan-associated protein
MVSLYRNKKNTKMKTKSGITRITKAALLILVLTMTVQTGFGQILGIYSKAPKKSGFKNKYKCQEVGIQKVKHIKVRSSKKREKPIQAITLRTETITASIKKTEPEYSIQPTIVLENTIPVVKENEVKDSTPVQPGMKLLPLPVYFRYDSYRLDIIDLTQIALAVNYVKEGHALTLIGHTDNWGSERYNETLSFKRASIIKDIMVKLGCNPELITAKGEGEKYPIATNEHEEGRQNNRRVEFLITPLNVN